MRSASPIDRRRVAIVNAEYFSHITKSMGALVGSVIKEETTGLFKRSPQVLIGNQLSEMSTDYHLFFLGKEFMEQDNGSFTCPAEDGSFQVFKNPVHVRVSYLLVANGLLSQNKLKTYDRLLSFFFDRGRIDPFLPESYKSYPGLYQRMEQDKAEIVVRGDLSGTHAFMPSQIQNLDLFRMVLDYTALYHSGTLLREENRVKQRVIEYAKNSHERSVQ